MNRRLSILLGLGLLVTLLALYPASASAQPHKSETVTATVSVVTPGNNRVTGSIVAHRTLDGLVSSSWSFTGMVNGQAVNITGTAIERWIGEGREEIYCTSISGIPENLMYLWETSSMNTAMVPVQQMGEGLVTVMGFPLSINNPTMLPPGSGNHHYSVGNAGAGSTKITRLPGAAATRAAPADTLTQRLWNLWSRRAREE